MPKQAKSSQSTTRPMRIGQRAQAARKQRTHNFLLIGGVALFVQLIAFVIYLNTRGVQPVAGEQVLASQGNTHIKADSSAPLAYNSTPPTSGPHYGNLVAWNIYREPKRYENLIHNLEDGGAIIYYPCPDDCPTLVKGLTALVDPYLKAGRKVLLTPNNPQWQEGNRQPLHKDMGAKIAVTAWQHLLTMDAVDSQKLRAFIDKYEGIDHHNGGS